MTEDESETDQGQSIVGGTSELASSLRNLFEDGELCDVTLEGVDGEQVSAHRLVLASRSKVFRRMLFGDFAEGRASVVGVDNESNVVRLDFEGNILRILLEHFYKDDAKVFSASGKDEETARTLSKLATAAHYFDVPKLEKKAISFACQHARFVMQQEPASACRFLDESIRTAQSEIAELALGTIRGHMAEILESQTCSAHIPSLCAPALESILKDERIECDEFTVFRWLKCWVDGEGHVAVTDNEDRESDGSGNRVSAERQTIAINELASHICLARIPPSKISKYVKSSGLFRLDRIHQAYEVHALQLESQHGFVDTKRWRPPIYWESVEDPLYSCTSRNHTVELLGVKPFTSRIVYKWKVKVERLCVYTWIGVACPSLGNFNRNRFLGDQQCGWVCGDNGAAYAMRQGFNGAHPCFTAGSTLTMTLDLTRTGSLWASVDSGEKVKLFGNMLESVTIDNAIVHGFVPAVSLMKPGSVRFLGLTE